MVRMRPCQKSSGIGFEMIFAKNGSCPSVTEGGEASKVRSETLRLLALNLTRCRAGREFYVRTMTFILSCPEGGTFPSTHIRDKEGRL